MLHPHVEGRQDQLTGAAARGVQWIAQLRRHQMQAGGRRHLDDGALAIPQQTDEALYLVAEGGGHMEGQNAAAGGIHQGLHRPLAAISHRQFDVGGIRQHLLETGLDGIGHRHGAEALLE